MDIHAPTTDWWFKLFYKQIFKIFEN
jgi:hypothetical protein